LSLSDRRIYIELINAPFLNRLRATKQDADLASVELGK
jgi:hypothetical protein